MDQNQNQEMDQNQNQNQDSSSSRTKAAGLQNPKGRPQRYCCDHCEQVFTTSSNLKRHKKTHTGDKPYSCGHCGVAFTRQFNLINHQRIHTGGDKPYRCDQCGAAFAQKGSLTSHQSIHTGDKPYRCDQCGAAFAAQGSLTSHQRIHTGDKPYRCDQCGAAFARKSDLTSHQRIHTGDKPYRCDQCGAAFAHQSSVTTHQRIHTGDKPYRCDQCGAAFSQQGALRRHQRIHTGDKPYRCDQCGVDFARQSGLRRHQRIHTGDKPYRCDQCGAAFAHQSSLTTHQFFEQEVPPPFQGSGLVPDWACVALTQTRLTPYILDVLQLQRISLGFAVQPRNRPSVYAISRPIRQVMYGLLLGGEKSLKVKERDRDGSQLIYVPVQPAFTETSKRLRLSSLHEADSSERLLVLLEALGVTEESLSLFPDQLKLPVAVTCFWRRTAQPPTDVTLLKALLLGISKGVVTGPNAASQMGNRCGGKKPDMGVVYAFNQWQACLKDSVHLNQLLGFPLPEPEIARLYQGTTVHQLVDRMRSGGRLRDFLKRTSVDQYHRMLSAVQLHTSTAPAGPGEPAKSGGPAEPAERDGPAEPAERDGPAEPAERDGPAEPAERGGPAEPAKRDGPAEPAESRGRLL
ncbi:zinc finger protein 271-like [Cololabis saira]|uniref:zinc finger protein 271-like n=1 Tax=Cololabis saira TaxID=129043 RepID=UPI002AD4FC94|nr:zinc finger protein 271-like [Cololabis saira]